MRSRKGEFSNGVLMALGIVSMLALCFMLVWIAFQGTAKYEAARAVDDEGYPVLQPYESPEESYHEQLQEIQASEAQIRQQSAPEIIEADQEMDRRFDNLDLQKDLMKMRRTF